MIQNFVKHKSILVSSIIIFVMAVTVSFFFYLGNKGLNATINFNQKSLFSFNKSAAGANIETNYGNLEIVFLKDEAPLSVNSFIKLVKEELYNGIKTTRLTKDFIQFSDPSATPEVSWNEINNELMTFGALATVPATGGDYGGFFIVTNYSAPWLEGEHAVFARVIKGLEVLTAITKGEKNNKGELVKPVVIKSIVLK